MQLFSQVSRVEKLDNLEILKTSFQDHRFPAHCHSTMVIETIEKGIDWCCVNELIAYEGDIFVHLPLAAHSGGTQEGQRLEYSAIYPTVDLIADLLNIAKDRIPVGKSYVIRDASISSAMNQLLHSHDSLNDAPQLLTRILQRIFDHIPLLPDAFDHTSNKIEMAGHYIANHCNRDLSIAELGELCGLSCFHFIRQFKRKMGITPRKYLISQRVALAKKLLCEGTSLVDTALDSGFADQSHLNRCFKRVTGYSPGQFVRTNQH